MLVTLQPPALSSTPMLLAVTPLPRPLTTPEVRENKVKNCFVLLKVRSGSLGKRVRCTTTTRGARDREVRKCGTEMKPYLLSRRCISSGLSRPKESGDQEANSTDNYSCGFAAFVDRRAERLCRFPGGLCTLNRDCINIAMRAVLDRWY